MKWYVLNHNFNSDTIEAFDIFTNSKFKKGVDELLKKYITFEDFKEKLKNEAMYCFWSKAEYEIICSGLFDKCKRYKIDVYEQIVPNIDILARNIIEEYNKNKRKKIEIK